MTNQYRKGFGYAIISVWSYAEKRLLDCYVDYEDLLKADEISGTWYANPARAPKGKYYVAAKMGNRTILLHRYLLDLTDPKVQVDHRDNDGLNNRRANLRTCTHKENHRFRQPLKDWAAYDRREALDELYRKERRIAGQVATLHNLTRQWLYRIRTGKNTTSKSAQLYNAMLAEQGIPNLAKLQQIGAGAKPRHSSGSTSTGGSCLTGSASTT